MVGLVLVSHSRALALALREMLHTLYGGRARVAVAAGSGESHEDLGTDAIAIMDAIREMDSPDGVAVLLDLGSAILSAETALDLLDEGLRPRVAICAAPLVEGAIAAAALSTSGANLAAVRSEAEGALRQKTGHLAPAVASSDAAAAAIPAGEGGGGREAASAVLRVENRQGLHARPAMRIVQAAAAFGCPVRIENLRTGAPPASARSLVEITCLEARQGDSIRVTANGAGAREAIHAFEVLHADRFGDAPDDLGVAGPEKVQASTNQPVVISAAGALSAKPLSDGIAIGPILFEAREVAPLPPAGLADPDAEVARLECALAAVRLRLDASASALVGSVGSGNASIFAAHRILLDDPALHRAAAETIRTERIPAVHAWKRATERVAAAYRRLEQPLLAERAADVEDLAQQVMQELGAGAALRLDLPPGGCILAVATLLPSEVAALDLRRVRGILAEAIGTTSHAAILLRAAGVAAASGVPIAKLRTATASGGEVAFDGSTGEIWVRPDEATRTALSARRDKMAAATASQGPAHTRDGWRVEIAANVATLADAEAAARAGAEAIGLLRTEFLFFDRAEPPGEDEQIEALRRIADAMPPETPVTVRTLDIGGDKPVPYLPIAAEANPFLGIRGLRLALRNRGLFLTQLRAILRAAHGRQFRVMFPMVTEVAELRGARAALAGAHAQLDELGIAHAWPVETGMMVEVPAAALNARSFIAEVDFFSLGTNDLTQYTLAAERGHPLLVGYDDALHPAVLRLIGLVAATARRHGKWAGICGEAAADPAAAAVFLGLGVRELSVGAGSVARLREAVGEIDLRHARPLARRCLGSESAAEVRRIIREHGSQRSP